MHMKVEGEAQGSEESIQKFLKDINNGPRLAHVVKLEKKTLDSKDGESQFGLRKTSATVFDSL